MDCNHLARLERQVAGYCENCNELSTPKKMHYISRLVEALLAFHKVE
jgi:hypothetical protein